MEVKLHSIDEIKKQDQKTHHTHWRLSLWKVKEDNTDVFCRTAADHWFKLKYIIKQTLFVLNYISPV